MKKPTKMHWYDYNNIICYRVTVFDKAGFHTHNSKAHSGLSDVLECMGGLQIAVVLLDKHPHSLPHNWSTICDICSSNEHQVRP